MALPTWQLIGELVADMENISLRDKTSGSSTGLQDPQLPFWKSKGSTHYFLLSPLCRTVIQPFSRNSRPSLTGPSLHFQQLLHSPSRQELWLSWAAQDFLNMPTSFSPLGMHFPPSIRNAFFSYAICWNLFHPSKSNSNTSLSMKSSLICIPQLTLTVMNLSPMAYQ